MQRRTETLLRLVNGLANVETCRAIGMSWLLGLQALTFGECEAFRMLANVANGVVRGFR